MLETCCRAGCTIQLKGILSSFDDGRKKIILCPNHALEYILDLHAGERLDIEPFPTAIEHSPASCDACGAEQNTVVYNTENYGGETLNIHLCTLHLHRLIARKLEPSAYISIAEKHGIFHEIHDDFYDNEGNAIQPVSVDF